MAKAADKTKAAPQRGKKTAAGKSATSDLATKGRAVIAELMGPDFIANRDKKQNSFNAAIQNYSDEVCFGMVWSRPGLPRKMRSILNVAILTALNRPNPLRTHINGALNNGCSVDELQEILLHAAVYCGLPAAVDAFRIAEEILKERGLLE